MTKKYVWKPTNTEEVIRHDDIWFVSSQEGWAVNADSKILYTKDAGENWDVVGKDPDGDAYFRCMSMTPAGQGWIGAIEPRTKRLWYSKDGQEWAAIDDKPPAPPANRVLRTLHRWRRHHLRFRHSVS